MMYEVIKLAVCGSHGFSSDVFMRNFIHGDLFHYFLMIRVAIPSLYIFNVLEFFI